MLHLAHNSPHPPSPSTQKPFSSVAYRRGSVPEIHSAETSSLHFYHHLLTARTPLAPLHLLTDADHQMTASPRSTFPGYAHAEAAQERERTADHLRYIGRPIVPTHAVRDAVEPSYPSTRRRSIPGQYVPYVRSYDKTPIVSSYNPHSGTTALRHPPIYTRTSTRRPNQGSSPSASSNRRPSLPTIHLQPSPSLGTPSSESYANPNSGLSADDLYSNLSSFTFGSAHTVHSDMGPVSPPSGTSSADPTPRPSISGPSSGSSHASSRTRSRTPKTKVRELDDEGCRADDEDEAEQQGRAKMRAMNDGTRRPSLPINLRRPELSRSPHRRMSVSSSAQRPGGERTRDSTPETSETDPDTGTRDGDGELDIEAGYFDTDVEMDYRHAIAPASRGVDLSDTASQHTFGGDYREYVYNPSSAGYSEDRMSVSETSEPDDDVPELPMVTQTEYTIDTRGNVAVVQGRRSSIPWATLEVPETSPQDREDSLSALPGSPTDFESKRQQASNPTDLPGVQSPSQDHRQPPESDPFSGFNLGYILGTRADDNADNKSWHSAGSAWMQVDPHYAPPVPMDGARPSADFEAFEFQGWGAPVTDVSGRRPSTATVGSIGEDAFMRHLQRYDPVSNTRAVEWTFKRESADGTSQDVIPGTRWVQGSARAIAPGTQEIWRQAHVGRFKVDKLLMRGPCAFAVDMPIHARL